MCHVTMRTSLAEVDASIEGGNQHLAYKTLQELHPWKPVTRSQLKSKTAISSVRNSSWLSCAHSQARFFRHMRLSAP